MSINSAFTPNADKLAQITGNGQAPTAGISPVYAAAVSLNGIINTSIYTRILGTTAVSATCAVTTQNILPPGAELEVSCESSVGTVTYTFGVGFKVSATAAPTVGTAITVRFRSNGANWIECNRSPAITY